MSRDPAIVKIHVAGGILCAAIASAAVVFAYQSIENRRGLFLSARHELTTIRADLDQAVAKRTSLALRVNTLEDSTRDEMHLSTVKRLNQRTAEISNIAETVGVSIDTLQPDSLIEDRRVPVQPLDLEGSAKASNVSVLLDRFDQEMPDMHIQEIEITSESLGSQRVRLRLRLYWFVDPADNS